MIITKFVILKLMQPLDSETRTPHFKVENDNHNTIVDITRRNCSAPLQNIGPMTQWGLKVVRIGSFLPHVITFSPVSIVKIVMVFLYELISSTPDQLVDHQQKPLPVISEL